MLNKNPGRKFFYASMLSSVLSIFMPGDGSSYVAAALVLVVLGMQYDNGVK